MKINIVYNFLYIRLEGSLLCLIINLRNFLKKVNIKIKYIDNNYLVYDKQNILFAKNKHRFKRLVNIGFKQRSSQLAKIYMLDKVSFEDGDNVVDVGADMGEIFFYFKFIKNKIKYCTFEPTNSHFLLKKNFPNSIHFNIALFKKSGKKIFFSKENTGDSSLIEMKNFTKKNTIEVKTLKFLDKYFTKIKLLKIDAEGAEPEVLINLNKINVKIEYISVDTGHERGIRKLNTQKRCYIILKNNNYEKISTFNDGIRIVDLYKKN